METEQDVLPIISSNNTNNIDGKNKVRLSVGSNILSRACNKICEKATKNDQLGRSICMIVIQFSNVTNCINT